MLAYVNARHMTAVAGGDLERSGAGPFDLPAGQSAWLMTDLGESLYTCIQNRTATAYTQGQLTSSVGGVDAKTAISNITSGSKVHAVTTGLTADAHVGALCYVVDSAQGTGIPPEGETAIVKRNTTTRLEFKDPGYTVALAALDDLTLRGTWNSELAASGDLNTTCLGPVVAENGIPAASFGYVQKFGPNRRVLVKASTAITVDVPLIADTGRVTLWGATAAANTVIGLCLGGASSDIVSDMVLAHVACGMMAIMGFGTIDANVT